MKKILLLIILIPTCLLAQNIKDSTNMTLNQKIIELQKNYAQIELLKKEVSELNSKYDYQVKINEQTISSISSQIGAASYNLIIFGILFGIAALGLGIYVTYIERKIVTAREENVSLLNKTIETKNEVVTINELIQKDIYGLFLKIKREETIHLLNRLLKVPRDISNLYTELTSRELEKEDYSILKEAYLKLKEELRLEPKKMSPDMMYNNSYKLLFFQHFLSMAVKDEQVGPDLIDYYPEAISCAFENDIIKSTEDFIKAIIDIGYQSKEKEINSFMKGISKSQFKHLNKIYSILFNGIKNRDDKFKFFTLISDEKETKISKSNFGEMLINHYPLKELTESEKSTIDKAKSIMMELEKKS
jgi:hypothetical protein